MQGGSCLIPWDFAQGVRAPMGGCSGVELLRLLDCSSCQVAQAVSLAVICPLKCLLWYENILSSHWPNTDSVGISKSDSYTSFAQSAIQSLPGIAFTLSTKHLPHHLYINFPTPFLNQSLLADCQRTNNLSEIDRHPWPLACAFPLGLFHIAAAKFGAATSLINRLCVCLDRSPILCNCKSDQPWQHSNNWFAWHNIKTAYKMAPLL